MAYKAIIYFTDGEDNGFAYETGDNYPRNGYQPTPERIAGLLNGNNKRGIPLIAEIKEPAKEEKPEKVEAAPKKKAKKTAKKK